MPVPCLTTAIIRSRTAWAVSGQTGWAIVSGLVGLRVPTRRTRYGRGVVPSLAIVAPTSAIRIGVTSRSA